MASSLSFTVWAAADELPFLRLLSVSSVAEGVKFVSETPGRDNQEIYVGYEAAPRGVLGSTFSVGWWESYKWRSTNEGGRYSSVWTNASPGWYDVYVRAHDRFNNVLASTDVLSLYVFPDREVLGLHENIANQEVDVNSAVQFKIKAFTDKDVRYQWSFNGQELPGEVSDTLSISNIQPRNEGFYSARVDTRSATVPSETAHVSVRVREPGYIHFENLLDLTLTNGQYRGIEYNISELDPGRRVIRIVELWAGRNLSHLSRVGNQVILFNWVTNSSSYKLVGYFDGGVRPVLTASAGERIYVQVSSSDRFGSPTRFSNCSQITLGTSNAPARLVWLSFPWYLEWPHPYPIVDSYFVAIEAGADGILSGAGWNYSAFDSEWRKNGIDQILTQRNVFLSECCMNAGIVLPLKRMQTSDVASYQLYCGYDFNHMLSGSARVVMIKTRAGRFLETLMAEDQSESFTFVFQGLGRVQYQLEMSSDLKEWRPHSTHTSADGLIRSKVDIDSGSFRGFRMVAVSGP